MCPLGCVLIFLDSFDQLDKRNLGFGCFSSCQQGFKKTQAIFSLKTTWHLDASGRSEVSANLYFHQANVWRLNTLTPAGHSSRNPSITRPSSLHRCLQRLGSLDKSASNPSATLKNANPKCSMYAIFWKTFTLRNYTNVGTVGHD